MVDILLVEDNSDISEMLCDFLRAEGYTVSRTDSGSKAVELFERYGAKLLLLDVMINGIDGFAVCEKIRRQSDVPIFIISARTDKNDKLNGLVIGADDYIEKPFDIDLLLAKISGLFRRRYSLDELKLDDLVINRSEKTASLRGKPLDMTAKEFELLLLLAENRGKTLTKEYLFSYIWGSDSESEQQTLTVHIKRLREKLERDPKKPEHIQTVWGVGYKFI